MKTGRVLSKSTRPLTQDEVEKFIINIFAACCQMHIFLYGFDYEEGLGVYTIGPREELEKLENSIPDIEDFDFENFIKTTDKDLIWLADWSDISNPKLNRMYKH